MGYKIPNGGRLPVGRFGSVEDRYLVWVVPSSPLRQFSVTISEKNFSERVA